MTEEAAIFDHTFWWIGFTIFVLTMITLDLTVFHRHNKVTKVREAFLWVAFWTSLAVIFNIIILFTHGTQTALEFTAGYLIEQSLSVDNLFVFIMVFSSFKISAQRQHRLLFWGILGALIFRAIMIIGGLALFERFHWITYVFGAFLVFTGIKLLVQEEKEFKSEENFIVKLVGKVFPLDMITETDRFFLRKAGKLVATKMFVVVSIIEVTDLVFALDSIPAVLAVSRDPFIVYTSNVFAILGLRSLYFALSGSLDMFRFLKYGVSVILIFVGIKMAISMTVKIPIVLSLGFIGVCIAGSIGLSVLIPHRKSDHNKH